MKVQERVVDRAPPVVPVDRERRVDDLAADGDPGGEPPPCAGVPGDDRPVRSEQGSIEEPRPEGAHLKLGVHRGGRGDYAANRRAFEQGERRAYALSRLDLEALVPVVRGERPLVVTVHRASDILATLALAREFGLRLILSGVDEGWIAAGRIAAAGVPVLLNPMDNLPSNFERIGATLENAARLRGAGVTVAFMTGDAHNARNIRQAAGNAVAYGMPWEEALAAMTSVPARIWGIADRYGTLEPGKDADVVIWSGDPLELATAAEAVFIRGEQIPMENRQTKLRDRYRNLARPLPPAYDHP